MKAHKMSIERNVTATLQNRFKESELEQIIFAEVFKSSFGMKIRRKQ